jgi:hypothetical protein
MSGLRTKPPGWRRTDEQNQQSAAFPVKENAAFFYSTKFYVLTPVASIICGTFQLPLCYFVKQALDKPPACITVHIPGAWQCYVAKYP